MGRSDSTAVSAGAKRKSRELDFAAAPRRSRRTSDGTGSCGGRGCGRIRGRGRGNREHAGQINMPREGIRFLPVDQNFQLPNSSHVCPQRLRDGIHGELFAENSRRSSGRKLIGKIRDGCSIRLNVESQQRGIRGQRAALRRGSLRRSTHSEVVWNARPDPPRAGAGWAWPRAHRAKSRKASTFAPDFHVGGRRDWNLHHFAARLLLGSGIALDSFDCLAQARQRDQAQHHQPRKNRNRRLESA